MGALFPEEGFHPVKLIPVALGLFYRTPAEGILEVWTQVRTDDGIYHGLLEFPGGGIEPGETPLSAVVREIEEEVGFSVIPEKAIFMGIYRRELPGKTILLYLHLFPDHEGLEGKGHWLRIEKENLSSVHSGKIPPPNHRMIDDLYRYLYDGAL